MGPGTPETAPNVVSPTMDTNSDDYDVFGPSFWTADVLETIHQLDKRRSLTQSQSGSSSSTGASNNFIIPVASSISVNRYVGFVYFRSRHPNKCYSSPTIIGSSAGLSQLTSQAEGSQQPNLAQDSEYIYLLLSLRRQLDAHPINRQLQQMLPEHLPLHSRGSVVLGARRVVKTSPSPYQVIPQPLGAQWDAHARIQMRQRRARRRQSALWDDRGRSNLGLA